MDKIGFSIIFGYRKGNSKALYYKKDIYPPPPTVMKEIKKVTIQKTLMKQHYTYHCNSYDICSMLRKKSVKI